MIKYQAFLYVETLTFYTKRRGLDFPDASQQTNFWENDRLVK